MQALLKHHNCKDELREASLRATPTRLAVLEILESTDKPIDVASIIKYLYKNKIRADKATVFRIINSFTDRGITKQLQLNEGKFRYELTPIADHHHFVCKKCGIIEDISDCNLDSFKKEIEMKKKLLVKSHSLEFFGICKQCQR